MFGPFVLYYGFGTWVVCANNGALLSAHASQQEAEKAMLGLPIHFFL